MRATEEEVTIPRTGTNKKSTTTSTPKVTRKAATKTSRASAKPSRGATGKIKARDIEKNYPRTRFIEKLYRFADSLRSRKPFVIQVAKETVYVPASAVISIEHERSDNSEELEFQLKWRPSGRNASSSARAKADKGKSKTAAKSARRKSTTKSNASKTPRNRKNASSSSTGRTAKKRPTARKS